MQARALKSTARSGSGKQYCNAAVVATCRCRTACCEIYEPSHCRGSWCGVPGSAVTPQTAAAPDCTLWEPPGTAITRVNDPSSFNRRKTKNVTLLSRQLQREDACALSSAGWLCLSCCIVGARVVGAVCFVNSSAPSCAAASTSAVAALPVCALARFRPATPGTSGCTVAPAARRAATPPTRQGTPAAASAPREEVGLAQTVRLRRRQRRRRRWS